MREEALATLTGGSLHEGAQAHDGRVDGAQLVIGQLAQARGQPRGAPGADGAQHAGSLGGDRQADAAPVAPVDAAAGHQARGLEPVDVVGHRGRRGALARGEVADADARGALDDRQQRHLAAAHAQRVELATQVAVDVQQDRAQAVGHRHRVQRRFDLCCVCHVKVIIKADYISWQGLTARPVRPCGREKEAAAPATARRGGARPTRRAGGGFAVVASLLWFDMPVAALTTTVGPADRPAASWDLSWLSVRDRHIVDEAGRTVLLHGFNTSTLLEPPCSARRWTRATPR